MYHTLESSLTFHKVIHHIYLSVNVPAQQGSVQLQSYSSIRHASSGPQLPTCRRGWPHRERIQTWIWKADCLQRWLLSLDCCYSKSNLTSVEQYDDFVLYYRYASTAYSLVYLHPLGKELIVYVTALFSTLLSI
jgi:hypothetical protein